MFRESSSTAADMLVLLRAVGSTLAGVVPYPQGWKRGRSQPGVLGRRTLRRTVQVRLGSNSLRILGGPPASPCPSAIGFASGDCRAGSHGGLAHHFPRSGDTDSRISASIKYLLFANGHPGEKSKPWRHRGHTDEAFW